MTTPTTLPQPPAPDGDVPETPDDHRWPAIMKRWWWAIAAALVLVVGAITVLAVNLADNDTAPTTAPSTTEPTVTAPTTAAPTVAPTTAPAPTTASTAAPTSAPAPDLSAALWPTAGSDRLYTDPLAATRGFATEYLGFIDPVVGPFRQGDTRSGEVDIRPRSGGPVTGVLVRQLDAAGHWYVLGAGTDTIEVTTPAWNATVGPPIALAGRAHAFEGVVNVEVRRDGQTRPVGTGTVMGGGTEMLPFTGQVAYTSTPGPGALVFVELSGENGTVTKATVVRVQLRGEG